MPDRRVVLAATGLAALAAGAAALARTGRLPGMRRGTRSTGDVEVIEIWTCQCGQEYRVQGEGRHRIYWAGEASDADPVLEGGCVRCERPLPGEHAIEAQATT
jgi:hypothetical protein